MNQMKNNPLKAIDDSYKDFETISHYARKQLFKYQSPLDIGKDVKNFDNDSHYLKYIRKENKLLYNCMGEPSGCLPDFAKIFEMFESVGISLGKEEFYRLQVAAEKLYKSTGANQIRFWGKMLARDRDYYVIETFIKRSYPDKVQSDTEPRGKLGVNQLTYWVTNDLLSDWVELPLISPRHILQAR